MFIFLLPNYHNKRQIYLEFKTIDCSIILNYLRSIKEGLSMTCEANVITRIPAILKINISQNARVNYEKTLIAGSVCVYQNCDSSMNFMQKNQGH